MQNWTTLLELPSDAWLAKPTRKLRDRLAGRIADLLDRRAALDKDRDGFASLPAAQMDESHLHRGQAFSARRLTLLQDEIALRTDLAGFFEVRSVEASTARDKAYEALQTAEVAVREALVSIGYVDAPTDANVIGKIVPDFVHRHPHVRAAQDALAVLDVAVHDMAFAGANSEALAAAEGSIIALRDRLAAAAV